MSAMPRLAVPHNVFRTVEPRRPANGELRVREYLTPADRKAHQRRPAAAATAIVTRR
jgi:hypothetical protein